MTDAVSFTRSHPHTQTAIHTHTHIEREPHSHMCSCRQEQHVTSAATTPKQAVSTKGCSGSRQRELRSSAEKGGKERSVRV